MISRSPLKHQPSFRKASLQLVPELKLTHTAMSKQATIAPVATIRIVPEATAKAARHQPQQNTRQNIKGQPIAELEQSLKELSNNALVLRCQNPNYKDRAAFEELVNRYQRYVDKLLYHLASDWSDRADLAQEIWIRVYRSIHRLKEPGKFKSWLGRITTNLFYDELRKRKRFKGSVSLDAPRYSSDGQYDWEIPSKGPTPTDTMMTQEFHDHLKTAMAELPEVFQKTIAMRELQGLSYEEIASITGVSLGTVKSRIARARQRLQEKLSMYLTPSPVSR